MTTRTALRRVTVACVAIALAVLGVITGPIQAARATPPTIPGQFIAKLYTEALGRLPSGSEWKAAVRQFADGGCTLQTLADAGQQVYTSADFARLGYDNTAKLTTLFRGVWNTEADPASLSQWRSDLSRGESWSTVVARVFVDDRFAELVPRICRGGSDSSSTSYGVGGTAAAALSTSTGGFSGTGAELQKLLDDTAPGGTVQLAGRTVVRLDSTLKVPSGVTLTTTDEPTPQRYADMGRLVRGADFDGPLVEVAGGGRLRSVWVDGARNNPGNSAPDRVNVRVLGGERTQLLDNKISNTAGAASIQVLGQAAGYSCSQVSISKNLITAYSNDHYQTRQLPGDNTAGTWSDGIDVGCADTAVTDNQLVDTGGVGVAVYRGGTDPSVVQHSRVTGNTIVSAGVPMYAAVTVDPLYYVLTKESPTDFDFTGTAITGNTVWTAPNTHLVIGISVGARPWYAGLALVGANTGHGVVLSGNGTGGIGARVRTGIAISGMDDVTVGSDPATWIHGVPGRAGQSCPNADLAAARSAGHADGLETRLGVQDAGTDGCMRQP